VDRSRHKFSQNDNDEPQQDSAAHAKPVGLGFPLPERRYFASRCHPERPVIDTRMIGRKGCEGVNAA
jgi:hypothetical protein